jgi:cell wall-associated NlpC family hydrolase
MLVFLALALAMMLAAMEAPAVLGKTPGPSHKLTQAQRVIKQARSHVGARFRMGAEGQRNGRRVYFDCSGLVYRVYKDAGLLNRIGGGRMRVTTYMRWFQRRGLANKHNPKPGDLIVWAKRGHVTHMGIYVGGNKAISALINPWGVRTHRVNGLPDNVMTYLHVRIER